LSAISLDHEIKRSTLGGPNLRRPGDRHQRAPTPNQGGGPLPDVAANDIEHQIDATDIGQRVVI
jgi:hypothetical protein